jgi:hypothetical protein
MTTGEVLHVAVEATEAIVHVEEASTPIASLQTSPGLIMGTERYAAEVDWRY